MNKTLSEPKIAWKYPQGVHGKEKSFKCRNKPFKTKYMEEYFIHSKNKELRVELNHVKENEIKTKINEIRYNTL